jgi:hypothetical protein
MAQPGWRIGFPCPAAPEKENTTLLGPRWLEPQLLADPSSMVDTCCIAFCFTFEISVLRIAEISIYDLLLPHALGIESLDLLIFR